MILLAGRRAEEKVVATQKEERLSATKAESLSII